MKTSWILEEDTFNEGESLLKAVQDLGLPYEVVKYGPFASGSYDHLFPNQCVVAYGSLNLVSQLQRLKLWVPGPYCTFENFDCTNYYPKFGPRLFNGDYLAIYYGQIRQKLPEIKARFGSEVFIRPNSGMKLFPGQVIYTDHLTSLNSPDLEARSIVLISKPRIIKAEYRFFVCGNEVVAGSQYRKDGQLSLTSVIDGNAQSFAQSLVSLYQPDKVYSLDICEAGGKFWLLELNSFSCAGLYACDASKLVQAVSIQAQLDYDKPKQNGLEFQL